MQVVQLPMKCRVATRHSDLNLRSGPGEKFPVVSHLPRGTMVQVFQTLNGWARVDGKRWVSAHYLQPNPTGTDPGTATPAGSAADAVLTLHDAAHLANTVYGFAQPSIKWKEIATANRTQGSGADGFEAALYANATGTKVVVYAGTNDGQDVVQDLFMLPHLRPGVGARALVRLLIAYGVTNVTATRLVMALGEVLGRISRNRQASVYINALPYSQTLQAISFFRDHDADYVVGHSLGGALAKAVSTMYGVRCFAFNSPCMGSMITPSAPNAITNVNARLDPLSFLTREVGNRSHGQVIEKEVTRFSARRGAAGSRPARSRRPVFSSLPPSWSEYLTEYLADLTAAGVDVVQELQYIADAATHYHGMRTLAACL